MSNNNKNTVKFAKICPEAVIPSKTRNSDSGYDLTLIGIEKKIGEKVILCRTGIKVKPPEGFYFDMVGRSSIIKSGYMVAHNVGIIDAPYRGEVFVPLIKVDESAPDIQFPIKLCQLIPRSIQHFDIEEINENELDETDRGTGGFGSTNSK